MQPPIGYMYGARRRLLLDWDPLMMPYILGVTLLLLTVIVLRVLRARASRAAPYPPGPPAYPVIGSVGPFPAHEPHLGLAELAKKYGDVMYFEIFGKPLVVLSSLEAASDLLEKRSAIYSSRPRFAVHEMIGWTDMVSFLPYGEQFNKQRKFFLHTFSKQGCLVFRSSQVAQTHLLLKNILQCPTRYIEYLRLFSTAVIMEIAYGHKVSSEDDPYVKIAEDTNNVLMAAGHSLALVDFLPWLRHLPAWFPGNWFARVAQESRPVIQRMRNFPFDQVVQQMASGTASPSFVSMQIEELERDGGASPENLHILKIAASQMYGAGAETTWSTIMNVIAFLLLHPTAQRKAQDELDSVLRGERMPDFDDRKSLPYLDALLLEVMRLQPTAPLGVPHSSTTDDIYRGMFIPKDSIVLTNTTALAMDDRVYRNPTEFRPERFLPPHAEPNPNGIVFGWGRRICPGRYLADTSVWIVMASFLTVFEIVPERDRNGQDIIPEIQWCSGITSSPAPFPCVIRPRSEKEVKLVSRL